MIFCVMRKNVIIFKWFLLNLRIVLILCVAQRRKMSNLKFPYIHA